MEKNYNDDEITIDLRELFYELKQKWWAILLAAVIGFGSFGAYSKFVMIPQYTSTTMMYVLSKETTLTSLADLQIGSQLTKDYSVIITSRPVLEEVIKDLGLNLNYRQLKEKITISNPADTRILSLSVLDADPYIAKAIVDEIAQTASTYIGEIMEMTPPKIIEEGEVPQMKTSPSVARNAAIGGLLGIVLVCGAVTLFVVMNDTIKTEEDIEKYLGISALAVVPEKEVGVKSSRNKKRKKKQQRFKESQEQYMRGKVEWDEPGNAKEDNEEASDVKETESEENTDE